jgi:hypothetical protein
MEFGGTLQAKRDAILDKIKTHNTCTQIEKEGVYRN